MWVICVKTGGPNLPIVQLSLLASIYTVNLLSNSYDKQSRTTLSPVVDTKEPANKGATLQIVWGDSLSDTCHGYNKLAIYSFSML